MKIPVSICNENNCERNWFGHYVHVYCGFQPLPDDFEFGRPDTIFHNLHESDQHRIIFSDSTWICSSRIDETNRGKIRIANNETVLPNSIYDLSRLVAGFDLEHILVHLDDYLSQIQSIFHGYEICKIDTAFGSVRIINKAPT